MKYKDKVAMVLDRLGIPKGSLEAVLPVSIDMYEDFLIGSPHRSAYKPRLARALGGSQPSSRLYSELMSLFKGTIHECTCAGAFGGFTPDHALSICDSGGFGKTSLGGARRRKSVAGYTYADPEDYRLRESDLGKMVLPHGIKVDYLTYVCYEDGKLDPELDQTSRLVRDAKDYVREKHGEFLSDVDVRVFADQGQDEFRVFFRTVNPVYKDGYNRHYPGSVKYDVYAQGSLVYDDAQEARDCGWKV